MNRKVIIVGGGLGGLSAAIHLKKQGFQVTLLEKNSQLGGKMSEFMVDGFRFDTGPSLLTMPNVIDELFRTVGVDRKSFLEFMPVEPVCKYFWQDRTVLNASTDITKMTSEMRKISIEDANRYADFLQYTKQIYDLTANIFLHAPIHEWQKMLTSQNLKTLFSLHRIDPLHSMHQAIAKYFRHPKIQQLFDRYATYNGSNPYQAPATLNIISYVEHGLGGYYIKGGMYRLVEALQKLAESMGVEIHTNVPVDKIVHQQKQIKGIVVAGEFFEADYVVCNADVVTAHQDLIDNVSERRKKLKRLEPSLSGMVFLWGINKRHPQLAHHNIFFSADYQSEFQQIFCQRRAPHDPTIYVAITSKTDPTHAPAGMENWFVLLNMPYLETGQDWRLETNRMRDTIFSKLKNAGIDVAPAIETENVFTPVDFQKLYGSNRGSIYGISSNQRSTAFRRPANRSRDIQGLYFAGGSTHPGGGIPLVLLSGKMTAQLIAEAATSPRPLAIPKFPAFRGNPRKNKTNPNIHRNMEN